MQQYAMINAALKQIDSKQRKSCLLHGQHPHAFWLGWGAATFVRCMVNSICVIVGLYATAIFKHTDGGKVVIVLIAFSAAQTAFTMLLGTVFAWIPRWGKIVLLINLVLTAGAILVPIMVGHISIPQNATDDTPGALIGAFLLHTNALGSFIYAAAVAEAAGAGVMDLAGTYF